MPSPSADRLINRITALHKSLQLDDGGKISAMERDLMLGYLRELYELYANGSGQPQVAPPKPSPAPSPSPAPAPAPPKASAPPPPQPVKAVPRPVPAPPPAPKPAPVAPPPPPVVKPPSPAPPPVPLAASGDLNALFAEDAAASPFGRQPLADLTKALTINNRVLFSRDLFGGDNDLLNTTLRTLNSSGAMAAAQPVLESLARRFEWSEEAKQETAREFIELVRRRYA